MELYDKHFRCMELQDKHFQFMEVNLGTINQRAKKVTLQLLLSTVGMVVWSVEKDADIERFKKRKKCKNRKDRQRCKIVADELIDSCLFS